MTRDWSSWHRGYDDPTSALSRRLDVVVEMLRSALDRAPVGPIRLISLCSGDARDVARALADHPRRDDVTGCLIEFDPELADAAGMNMRNVGSHHAVRCGDASDPGMFIDLVPADVLLLVGIFGNIDDCDVQRRISVVPAICRQGATVIWTRHRREPDLTPSIVQWFEDAGCEASTFSSPGPGSFAVGSERCRNATSSAQFPGRLFAFRDELW